MSFKKLILRGFVQFCTVFFFFFSACKKENMCDCFKRTGKIIKEKRAISGFTQLLVKDNLNVFIIQDSLFEVTVEAGENIVPLITTEIDGNTLVCRNKNRCNWTRSYKQPLNIYVHMPVIDIIESDGTGDIKTLNTIQASTCFVQTKNSGNIDLSINTHILRSAMHGSSDLILHGKADSHGCDIGGTGFLNASDFNTGYTYLHTYTIGLCYIYARDLLICKIDQKGDVFCYGNPKTVDATLNGSGKLHIQ